MIEKGTPVGETYCRSVIWWDDDGIYNEEGCGERPFGPRLRVDGGEIAEENEIPWAALLKRKEKTSSPFGEAKTSRASVTAKILIKVYFLPTGDRATDPNDIAIVQLYTPAVEKGVWPICLPSEQDQLFKGEKPRVAGWGIHR
ncbi:hypothetical protein COOONC_12451 [Cooperia oncophora]